MMLAVLKFALVALGSSFLFAMVLAIYESVKPRGSEQSYARTLVTFSIVLGIIAAMYVCRIGFGFSN